MTDSNSVRRFQKSSRLMTDSNSVRHSQKYLPPSRLRFISETFRACNLHQDRQTRIHGLRHLPSNTYTHVLRHWSAHELSPPSCFPRCPIRFREVIVRVADLGTSCSGSDRSNHEVELPLAPWLQLCCS